MRCVHTHGTKLRVTSLAAAILAVLAVTGEAHAYAGAGSGLAALGTLVALLGALLAGIVGFVWFPIKRMFKRKPAAEQASPSETAAPE